MLKNILISTMIGITPIAFQISNTNHINISDSKTVNTNEYINTVVNTKYTGGDNNDYRVAFHWIDYASSWDEFIAKYKEIGLSSQNSCSVYVDGTTYSTTDKTINTSDIKSMNWDDIYEKPSTTFSVNKSITNSNTTQKATSTLWFTYDSKYVYYLSSWYQQNDTDNVIGSFAISRSLELYE